MAARNAASNLAATETWSDFVDCVVPGVALDDGDDLAAFDARAGEPDLPFEAVIKDLKRRGASANMLPRSGAAAGASELLIKPSASRELEALPPALARQLVTRIRALAADPKAAGTERLPGQGVRRVRHGARRVVYAVSNRGRKVVVVSIACRAEGYA